MFESPNLQQQQQLWPTSHSHTTRGKLSISFGCVSSILNVIVMCFVAAAALFSVHVGFKVLGAASEVQTALEKLQTVLTIFYTFACKNENFDIFTPDDCQALCVVIYTNCP